jgi:hypothetical protein
MKKFLAIALCFILDIAIEQVNFPIYVYIILIILVFAFAAILDTDEKPWD